MVYVNNGDIKALPNDGQVDFSVAPKFPGLWDRVLKALGVDKPGQVASILDISASSVSEWKNQGKPPSLDNLLRIAKLGNTSVEWLLTGEGPSPAPYDTGGVASVYFGKAELEIIKKLAQESSRDFDSEVRELVLETLIGRGLIKDQLVGANLLLFGEMVPKLIPVRLWGEIAAGKPIDVFEQDETVLIPDSFLVKGREHMVLRVRGNSMEDEGIFEGDFIIGVSGNWANNGDLVVALIDGESATVKRFYREKDRVRLEPRSANHQPMVFDGKRVEIQGIVQAIFRRTT